MLSGLEGWENSDSDGAMSLDGGRDISPEVSAEDEVKWASWEDSSALPTKQHRVLTSSMTASVSISSGTRVARLAAGMFVAALSDVGGGK